MVRNFPENQKNGGCNRRFRPGFTLVELLVVIGIIAILIGILLPSLSKARESSKRAACAAKLHAMMVAAYVHEVDHQGYFPLAGQLVGASSDSGPASLDDTYRTRYTWTGDSSLLQLNSTPLWLAPITLALGTEMGFKQNLNLEIADALTANGLSRNFQCPSQAVTDEDLTRQVGWIYSGYFGSYYGGFTEQMSYIFNEGVLGFDDNYKRLKGKLDQVRQPSKTFFACDGNPGEPSQRFSGTWTGFNVPPTAPPQPWGSDTIWNNNLQSTKPYNNTMTLNDALLQNKDKNTGKLIAGTAQNFDQIRHKGKINIAFCDGHVEQRDLPPFTLSPSTHAVTFNNGILPKNALADVYIIAP